MLPRKDGELGLQALWEISREAKRSPDVLPHKILYRKASCRFDKLKVKDSDDALAQALPVVLKFWDKQGGVVLVWNCCTKTEKLIEIEALLVYPDDGES